MEAPKTLLDIIFKLQLEGYKVVLAHPERYAYYEQEDYENFKQGIQYSLGFIANLLSKKGLEKIYLNSETPLLRSERDLELEDSITIKKNISIIISYK